MKKSRRRAHRRGQRPSGPGNGDNAIVQEIRAGRSFLRMFGIRNPERALRDFRGEM
jgi:hypothetical protein